MNQQGFTVSAGPAAPAPKLRRGNRSFILGRLVVTTVNQGGGAPLVDQAYGNVGTDRRARNIGRRFRGWAVLLAPWRRNQYGESLPQRALVVGWLA